MIRQVWTEETVIAAIREEVASGHDLSYSGTQRRVPSLLRAAERVFGQWAAAVEAAGFDYAAFRKYRRWTREQVIAAVQAHAEAGADLSWRHVSTVLDPPLAYAALHAGRFASWDAALAAAGLDPDTIRRYQNWNWDRVVAVLWSLAARGVMLDQPTLSQDAPDALAAFYRRGGSLRELRAHYTTAETSPDSEPFALLRRGGARSTRRDGHGRAGSHHIHKSRLRRLAWDYRRRDHRPPRPCRPLAQTRPRRV